MNEKIQYYKSFIGTEGNVIFNSKASGETTIANLLESIKNPKPKYENLIDKIRTESNKETRNNLKSQLPGFIIQSFGDGLKRRNDNIVSFTGYTVLDFDGEKVKSYANDLKQFLFNKYDFIVASYISPSGAVKCIMRIGISNSLAEYKSYYRAIEKYFNQYNGFDPTPKNAVLIMYYTYDRNILIRDNASIWNYKIKDSPPPKVTNPIPFDTSNIDLNYKRAYGLISGLLSKIVDNGHPQLISASKLLGGYATRYNLSNVEGWLHSEIENHPYFSKGISGYKKTASKFINYGMAEPIDFPS